VQRLARVAAFIVAATIAWSSSPSQPTWAANDPPALTASTAAASYAPGEPVQLTFTVANRGSSPCRVVGLADGTIQVLSMTRDGAPVTAQLSTTYYYPRRPVCDAARPVRRALPA
jgi:hypothetical protein